MQIAHYVCKYAKMWFWSVSASFKQAQPLQAEPTRQVVLIIKKTCSLKVLRYFENVTLLYD